MSSSSSVIVQKDQSAVATWLYIVAILTVAMVALGGATRLTDSGLSITEWAPISGALPPLSHADWLDEFAKYQTTDEFKTQNSAMTLEQFRTIYWWEWAHRLLGRVIGLAVLLPMIFFWATGRLSPRMKLASLGLFALVCFQGFLGWWMVKSGLVARVDVSQIRLAVHLTTACIFFVATIWLARGFASQSDAPIPGTAWQAGALVALVLVQIFAGGLVAGLDAGMAYNTWPKMNGMWAPDGIWSGSPAWTNFTDNAAMVQLVHRTSAYLLWVVALVHAVKLYSSYAGTIHARRGWFLLLLITGQALIGIVTLVMQVPVAWALAHQFGALVVLAFATAHWRAMLPLVRPSGVGQIGIPV